MKESSFKYLPTAYDPETTRLANRLPSWHPMRTKRMSSVGHQLMNSTMGSGMSDINYRYLEGIDNTFLGTCRTDQVGPVYVKTTSKRPSRSSSNTRNMLFNAGFEWAPRISDKAWQWYTVTEKISDQTTATDAITRDHTSYYYGGTSLKVTLEQGYQAYIIQSVTRSFKANETIGISVMYKGENTLVGDDGIRLYLTGEKLYDGSTTPTSVVYGDADTENIFTRLTEDVHFAHDVNNVNFVIKIVNSSSGTMTYYIDAAQMELAGSSGWHIRYDDPVWFVDTENNGPFDVFYSDTYKRRVIYCSTTDDFMLRTAPTRAILSTLSRNISLQTSTKTHSRKIEFDRKSWTTEFKIESNQIVRFNSSIPDEAFATYNLYELNDDNTWSVNSSATLHDFVIIGELLYIIAYEDSQYVLKICNPEMNEPEDSYIYVINTIPIEDDYEILNSSVSSLSIVQATGRDNLFALDVEYQDGSETDTVRFGVTLMYDYYIYDDTSNQIITRENYNNYGGIIIT